VERNRNELKVGLAVIISLIMLVVGIMWAKGFSLKVKQYDFVVVFKNVQGLEPGASVLANGLDKGRVHDIELSEGRVLIHASVDNDVKIFSDYRIVIESPTLLAGKVLSIYPGGKPPYADLSKPLQGSETLGMTEAVEIARDISQDLKHAIQNLNEVLVNLNDIVGDSANQANLAGTLTDTRDAAQMSVQWLRENRETLTKTLDRMEETFNKAQQVLNTTDVRIASTADQVDTTLARINELSSSVHQVLTLLQSDQTTAGKLLHDDDLYIRLNDVLAELDSLAVEVREHGLKMRHSLKIF
jgi:phospholipid/cholesterol/gamma-HCH transport system substrate-binding protein